MIKGGKGGASTLSGLKFETRTDLKTIISSIKNYRIDDNLVYFNDKEVARLYRKHDLYKKLLEPKGVQFSEVISKKLLPDDSILVLVNKTLHIIEIKFQEVDGSVDEKLQTCDFKNKQYNKLMKPLGFKVKYIYVLNNWFLKPQYKDVLSYIADVGCFYFFNEIPLDFLGMPKP